MCISLTFAIIPVSSLLSLPARVVVFNPVVMYIGSSVAREAMRGGQVGLLELLTNNGCVLDGLSEEQVRKAACMFWPSGTQHSLQYSATLWWFSVVVLLLFVLISLRACCVLSKGSTRDRNPRINHTPPKAKMKKGTKKSAIWDFSVRIEKIITRFFSTLVSLGISIPPPLPSCRGLSKREVWRSGKKPRKKRAPWFGCCFFTYTTRRDSTFLLLIFICFSFVFFLSSRFLVHACCSSI